jgi:hypothetical protein
MSLTAKILAKKKELNELYKEYEKSPEELERGKKYLKRIFESLTQSLYNEISSLIDESQMMLFSSNTNETDYREATLLKFKFTLVKIYIKIFIGKRAYSECYINISAKDNNDYILFDWWSDQNRFLVNKNTTNKLVNIMKQILSKDMSQICIYEFDSDHFNDLQRAI